MHRAKRTHVGRIAIRTGGDDYNAAFDIRTTAGPSRVWQWVLMGGPYTVCSHVRHIQVVCPPP